MFKISHLLRTGIIGLLIVLCIPAGGKAQSSDSKIFIPDSIMEKKHSPRKATIMSALLPGLGQIYNKKYWKVPVIYVGFGVMTYFIVTNANEYINYKCAYIEKSYGDTAGSYSNLVNKYSAANLLSAREYYRRNLEISILLTTVWYIINIVDASVDAHLFTYNISKDLSLKVEPTLLPPFYGKNYSSGIKLSLHF
jgi:hypothetical protein